MKIIAKLSTSLLTAGILLTGCQSVPHKWSDEVQSEIDASLATAKPSAVPPEVSQALVPPIEIQLPEGGTVPLEPRFDLTVNNTPARQVFLGIVEGTRYSMVLSPEVNGSITLHLKEVTVPEAMEAIRRTYGYAYRRDGARFLVYGRGMQTRIFPVNYLNLTRKGKSDTRVINGELTQTTSQRPDSGTGSGTGTSSGQTRTRVPSIRVETDSQADFWKDLKETLGAIVGKEEGRQIVVNPQTGVVVVRAMPDEMRMVEEYLGLTHDTVNRQVVLEAKIIDVELNDRFQTGINWAHIAGDVTLGQVGGGTILNNGVLDRASEIARNAGNLNPGTAFSAISGTNASAFGGVFTISARTGDFAAFVELLQTQGNVKVLSSPRVSTVNNQKAVIKVGGEEFFVTGVTSQPSTVGLSTVFVPEVELTPFFSGIALDVTPQIDANGAVILHIHPSVSEVVQRTKEFVISDQIFSLPLAASSIQESDNVVRSPSGQIIVIGGLMKEGSTSDHASIPLLGDIPIVGNLFKHKRLTRIKRELVILLKPTIVNFAGEWDEEVKGVQERVRKIRVGS